MFIVDLACHAGHAFEGWYESADEYRALFANGDITCPLCESHEVRRIPSASRISTATTRGEKTGGSAVPMRSQDDASSSTPAAPQGPGALPLPVQKALSKVLDHVRRTHEYVGDAFAERAIQMHRGEEALKPIHGHATTDDERRMQEEGVEFMKLPIPDIEQN